MRFQHFRFGELDGGRLSIRLPPGPCPASMIWRPPSARGGRPKSWPPKTKFSICAVCRKVTGAARATSLIAERDHAPRVLNMASADLDFLRIEVAENPSSLMEADQGESIIRLRFFSF